MTALRTPAPAVPGSYPSGSHIQSPCRGCGRPFVGFSYVYPPERIETDWRPEHLFRYRRAPRRSGRAHATSAWRCLTCTDRIWKRATIQAQLAADGALIFQKGAQP